jgi:hypothetical protein
MLATLPLLLVASLSLAVVAVVVAVAVAVVALLRRLGRRRRGLRVLVLCRIVALGRRSRLGLGGGVSCGGGRLRVAATGTARLLDRDLNRGELAR